MEYKFLNIHIEVIDFDQLEKYAHLIAGDDLFICLGTTIRKAGSVKRMEQIDRDLPVQIARIAFQNGVTRCAVVSSIGAGASSRNYYQRIKGEMENGIREIPFDRTIIARPSILFGRRHEFRFGELIGRLFMRAFGWVLFGPMKKYRGIHADRVAKAMINLLRAADEQVIYESDELQTAGKQ
jgi:uncharacterized protein YbjT (DUF2867 family)